MVSPDLAYSLQTMFKDHQMLEFCETVNPNLTNYEGDGVSISLFSFVLFELTNVPGLADSFG